MRRGARLWDQALKCSSSSSSLGNWFKLLTICQYIVPLLINLSASASFFVLLFDTPISTAVPVTNATTPCLEFSWMKRPIWDMLCWVWLLSQWVFGFAWYEFGDFEF
ncbi:Transmembrane protein [Quillaja saponaria]|uniref:Transmembrane protein n=1 Tax=Quillaja saponaria TaxID=32244 RepID=A0AAD7Q2X1_QUISA|nr:Transmembrane protein [Quillaja saponaria]